MHAHYIPDTLHIMSLPFFSDALYNACVMNCWCITNNALICISNALFNTCIIQEISPGTNRRRNLHSRVFLLLPLPMQLQRLQFWPLACQVIHGINYKHPKYITDMFHIMPLSCISNASHDINYNTSQIHCWYVPHNTSLMHFKHITRHQL